jgi:hypothetical protein
LHGANTPECDQFRIHQTWIVQKCQIPIALIARGQADLCEGRSPQWMLEDPATDLAISAWHILQLACG